MKIPSPWIQKVPPAPTSSNRWVIPDIHAHAQTLNALLLQIKPQASDQVFFLGDYINRGPDNVGVFKSLKSLKKSGVEVFTLRGNHEQMALDSHYRKLKEAPDSPPVPRLQKRKGICNDKGALLPQYHKLFEAMPFAFQLKNYYLVHAGFNFKIKNPLEDFQSMLWVKSFQWQENKIHPSKLIHGHSPRSLEYIQKQIREKASVIKLDNGIYRKGEKGFGNLLGFNLDTQALIIQANVD